MSISFEDKNGRKEDRFSRVLDPCANGTGELAEEVGVRGWELVATDESRSWPNRRLMRRRGGPSG
jgi:hypothetical protein